MILLYVVPSINTLVSTSNSIENNKSDALEKSSIYTMNRRWPEYGILGSLHVKFKKIRMAIIVLNKLVLERQAIFEPIEQVAPDSMVF